VDLLTFLQQVINGLSLDSLYALIAIGYTLVYGILRLINFAHGDLMMVAAYVAVMGVGLFHSFPSCTWERKWLPNLD
jgi:branched-chain amino acid transport system permease protein